MRLILCSVVGGLISLSASADIISYGGQEYVTIDWSANSELGDVGSGAVGHAGGVDVFFNSVGLESSTPTTYDYGSDHAIDSVSFETGMMDSLTLFGGQNGMSNLSFSQVVGDVLIFVGAPDEVSFATQFGASRWNFQNDGAAMDIVDSELGINGFQIEDSLFTSPTNQQISGILSANGDMTSLEWLQSSLSGLDRMQVGFAIVVPTVPTPAGGLVLLIPAAMCGRRRR